jgi:hypothetical protein
MVKRVTEWNTSFFTIMEDCLYKIPSSLYVCVSVYFFKFNLLHVPLLEVILRALIHIYSYNTIFIKNCYCSEFFGTHIHLDTRISKMFTVAILNELCLA